MMFEMMFEMNGCSRDATRHHFAIRFLPTVGLLHQPTFKGVVLQT